MQDIKFCSLCKTEKPLSEFGIRKDRIDKPSHHYSQCRNCRSKKSEENRRKRYLRDPSLKVKANERRANWEKNNKHKRKNYTVTSKLNLLQRKIQYKDNKPCMDCGVYYPYYVLDFDHRDPTTKIGNPMNLPQNLFESEIRKCDLVCANCHRIRTFKRLQLTETGLIAREKIVNLK